MIILHFALKNEWDNESKTNSYGSSCIARDGHIKCYKFSDISNIPFNFSTLSNYIILCIDDEKVDANIKYENELNLELVEPNIYGTIATSSVIKILPYTFDNEDKFVATDELLDFITINDACSNLNIKYVTHKYFHDGTTSRIILLNDEYIIKVASKEQLKAEVTFANTYKNTPLLQKIAYFDNEYNYIVYSFIPGDVMHTVTDFENLTRNLQIIISSYKNSTESGYGYIENPKDSWSDFLKQEVKDASSLFNESSSFLPIVEDAINELNRYPFDKKLIHGDFGTHNFIKKDERFIAAIDPTPIIGDPTYDLLFALVSNVDLIPFLSLDYLTRYTKEKKEKIIALLKVVLFCRICRCTKYNKEDLEYYLDFWYNLFG